MIDTQADTIKWYKIPVPKEQMQQFTQKNNAKGLLQAGSFLLIFAALGGLSYYFYLQSSWWSFGISLYLHCVFSNFIGQEAAVHELSHCTAFHSKKINDFFYKIFCFISWNNWVHFRYSHRKHHQLTLYVGRDYEVIPKPMKFRPLEVLFKFSVDIPKIIEIMCPNLWLFFGSTKLDFKSWDPLFEPDDPNRRTMIQWSRFVIIGQLILIALFIYWEQYILIAIVNFPTFFASWLARGCSLLQHGGLPSNVNDWRRNCYTFYTNPIIAYLYWHMNYHIEHHNYAAVPCYNLKKLHKAMLPQEPKPLPGYLAGLWHLFRVMLKQQKDLNYCYQQILPETQTVGTSTNSNSAPILAFPAK